MKTRWKFLNENLTSIFGSQEWKIDEWKKCKGTLKLCQRGFHGSKKILDALNFGRTSTVALVEVRGKSIIKKDKECWEEMRVVKVAKIPKEILVELAIFAAEEVLPIFEKGHPEDPRPRKVIEEAKKWMKIKNEGMVVATSAAYAAYATYAAAAAYATSATSVASAAYIAASTSATSAAYAAYTIASEAASAAYAAAAAYAAYASYATSYATSVASAAAEAITSATYATFAATSAALNKKLNIFLERKVRKLFKRGTKRP